MNIRPDAKEVRNKFKGVALKLVLAVVYVLYWQGTLEDNNKL